MIKSAHRLDGFTLKGFTLIELLVVIAIIGTLIAVVLPQLNLFNRDQVLKNTAADLKSNIRKTQNNASSGLNCNTTGLAAKNWTINFTKNATTYNIVATCSNETAGVNNTYTFPPGIKITDINIDAQSCDPTSVIFNNISSAINFATADSGCPISVNTKKMSIFISDTNAVGIGTTVVIEKGGAVY